MKLEKDQKTSGQNDPRTKREIIEKEAEVSSSLEYHGETPNFSSNVARML